jgi:hypothetical protein
MFAKILDQFSPENRVIVLELIRKKVDNDLHRLKLETDPLYVLERMGLEFSEWREFYYRGYVFICQKIFETPQNESSPKYDFRVRLGICPRHELYKLSGKTTREISSKFGFDYDRCDLLDIKPFIEHLIKSSPMRKDEYKFPPQDEFTNWGFLLLDKCLVMEHVPEMNTYIQLEKESRLAKKLGIDFHISPPCVYFNE